MIKKYKLTGLLLASIFVSSAAQAIVYDNAPTVQLLKSCTDSAGSVIDNCFQESGELTAWMKNTRKPNRISPLRVNIGVGIFDGVTGGGNFRLRCNPADGYTGYTSFVGAGAMQTIMNPGSPPVSASNCTSLSFSNFRIETAYHYITWTGGGDSRWSDMEIATRGGAWTEDPSGTAGCSSAKKGKHYWYSSRIAFGSTGNNGYTSKCDDTWFIGSEITLTDAIGGISPYLSYVLKAQERSEIHVYGGNIRALGFSGQTGNSNALIQAINGGAIHIHGTGIDLLPKSDTTDNIGIFYANATSTIHATSSAYAIQFDIGSASISRITEDGGSIIAPYNWGALSNPPPISASKTGSDTFIETDCNSAGICTGVAVADQVPHQMIYNSACNINGAWFDAATNACRQ